MCSDQKRTQLIKAFIFGESVMYSDDLVEMMLLACLNEQRQEDLVSLSDGVCNKISRCTPILALIQELDQITMRRFVV